MTGELVTSVHSRIEKYPSESSTLTSKVAHDAAGYLRRIQTLRERTQRWDSDRLRSGVRRIARVTYPETISQPEGPPTIVRENTVSRNLEMRRCRDAEIARRRQPPMPPRLGSIYGRRVERPPYHNEASTVETRDAVETLPAVPSPDLEVLRRLLCTPSRILAANSHPLARLSSASMPYDRTVASKSPTIFTDETRQSSRVITSNYHLSRHNSSNVPSEPPSLTKSPTSSSTPGARLPPVRGRLLPLSMARSLRSAQRTRLEDSLKTTRLPTVETGNQRSTAAGGHHADNGFRIYQQLIGGEAGRQNRLTRGVTADTLQVHPVTSPNVVPSERHPQLPLPYFPITQLLSKQPEMAPVRVDYISINVAIPRAEISHPGTPLSSQGDVRIQPRLLSEETYVPPPTPAYPSEAPMEEDDEDNENYDEV